MNVAGIVLAGGKSRRFGSNKALARWGENTLVEAVCDALIPSCVERLVVSKAPATFQFLEAGGCTLVQDEWAEAHALGGICSGLLRASTSLSFVCSCDVPLLQPGLVEQLIPASAGNAVTVPVWNGVPQTLCGVYSQSVIPLMREMILAGEFKILDFLNRAGARMIPERQVRDWDPAGVSFLDIDTPSDYERARSI